MIRLSLKNWISAHKNPLESLLMKLTALRVKLMFSFIIVAALQRSTSVKASMELS